MNIYYVCLLLLLCLSTFPDVLQHAKLPIISVSSLAVNVVYPVDICALELGILALGLPQNEVYEITPAQNGYNITILPYIGYYKSVILPALVFIERKMENLTLSLIYGGNKLAWAIRIAPDCFQHILRMYIWSLSENQVSIKLRCQLAGLLLKQSLLRKHDFAALIYKLYHGNQKVHVWHSRLFSTCKKKFPDRGIKSPLNSLDQSECYGGGKALVFSSDELLPYALTECDEKQYQFLRCIKMEEMLKSAIADSEILCNVPLNLLASKLTLKCAKEIATLHNMYMPSKILLKDAQWLLQDHKCHMCGDVLAVFRPYKVSSNAKRQRSWYEKNKKKRSEYNKHHHAASEYKQSHKQSSYKHYWSHKDVKFPPDPPSVDLCQKIISDFCADTSPEVFEEAGCAVCGKLTPIYEMEELSEVENISLLKFDGVTRKARSKSSDPVKELRGPILAPGCKKACPICVESLEKGNMPTLALANGLWIGEIPNELQDLTYAEQLLISRVRHNRCIVQVSSGMYKMRANAISFSNPMPKIYNILPPPIEEMDEVLAFIYTGPCKPTKADFK